MISEEEKCSLLHKADVLKIGRDRGEEIILSEMKKTNATFKSESHSDNTTFSSIPFDVLLNKTYYEILGVSEDADYAEIKKVYDDEHKKYIHARDKAKATARWVPVSEAWECLCDNNKRRKYDEEQRRARDKDLTPEGDPKLEIEDESGKERRSYEFKDMRLGTTQSVTVIAKNGGGGTLDASIKTSQPWLIVDTDKIHQSKLPQRITIKVDPKKNPSKNTFGGKDTGEIKINDKKGGDPYIVYIAYNIEEDVEDLKRFRRGVTIGGLVLGFIFGSQIFRFVEGEYGFLTALILIVIVSSRWGYKDAGGSGAFGWGFGTFVGGLIILLILQAWFPHTFTTVVWSLIYGSIANISSDFIRPAIRQENYQLPIGVGVGVLILTVMVISAGSTGAKKKRGAELAVKKEKIEELKRGVERYKRYSSLILGRWKIEVGICEYFKNGNFFHTSNSGEKTQGKWNIEGDALIIKFSQSTQRSGTNIYKILDISPSAYKIVGISGDRGTYNARKIKPLKSFQAISNKLPGKWEGNVGNEQAKLTITDNSNKNKFYGYIIYNKIKEYLFVEIRNNGQVVLRGTRYERLGGKGNFSLDTFYGRLSEDGRSISGNYVDTAGNKGNWSVTKHVYTYKTPPKTYTIPQMSMDEAEKREKAGIPSSPATGRIPTYTYKTPPKNTLLKDFNTAQTETEGTIKYGKYNKGGLGITTQFTTTQLQESFGLKDNLGALVSNIEPNSPAANAGIKSGDVIIKYNGSKIKDPFHLWSLVTGAEVNKGVEMVVIRDGKELTLNIAILESPNARKKKLLQAVYTIPSPPKRQHKTRKEKAPKDTEAEAREHIDKDKIKTKIKIIQRKLDDLMEQHIDTGKSISSMDMRTDSSKIADLEAERKVLAKKIKENNIQKGQLLNGLSVGERDELRREEGWKNYKKPIEKPSVTIHKTQTYNKQLVNNTSVTQHQQSTARGKHSTVTRVKLRSSRSRGLSKDDVKDMLGRYNLYDSVWNNGGDFANDYESQVINGDKVVIDHATGLMWHQSGSLQTMNWGETYQWVRELNRQKYAGYSNWRLPTIDEAVTLLESSKSGGEKGLHINPVFDSRQKLIWTSDEKAKTEKTWIGTSTSSGRYWWCVNFKSGTVSWLIKLIELNKHVRPVRTIR
ncbi:MAG: Lcl domain-containing protein [Candidatus Scalindua sp.]